MKQAKVTSQETAPSQCQTDVQPHRQVQTELALGMPWQSVLALKEKSPKQQRKTIQDVLIAEGLLALKLAGEAESPEQLQEILGKQLGQNSWRLASVTRGRY